MSTNNFTFIQLAKYHASERVKEQGLYNMFSPQAVEATGLSKEDYLFVMDNYVALKRAAMDKEQTRC